MVFLLVVCFTLERQKLLRPADSHYLTYTLYWRLMMAYFIYWAKNDIWFTNAFSSCLCFLQILARSLLFDCDAWLYSHAGAPSHTLPVVVVLLRIVLIFPWLHHYHTAVSRFIKKVFHRFSIVYAERQGLLIVELYSPHRSLPLRGLSFSSIYSSLPRFQLCISGWRYHAFILTFIVFYRRRRRKRLISDRFEMSLLPSSELPPLFDVDSYYWIFFAE